uniref:Endonuclease/exonuclease/phosphatase domain-containing protein n=1 Tax=Paramormyrops kingsleyae TaxID=1676925 RepID=A0A3B3T895_9TELE
MANINIASWNVRALNAPEKRSSVTEFLKRQHADLAFLIETHLLQRDALQNQSLHLTRNNIKHSLITLNITHIPTILPKDKTCSRWLKVEGTTITACSLPFTTLKEASTLFSNITNDNTVIKGFLRDATVAFASGLARECRRKSCDLERRLAHLESARPAVVDQDHETLILNTRTEQNVLLSCCAEFMVHRTRS